MTNKNKIKCPECGETENIKKKSKIDTYDGPIYTYKCLKCGKQF